MVQNTSPVRPRALRPGRPDGTSTKGQYVARWTDEDTGPHVVTMPADSEQDVRDFLEPYVGSNSLTINRIGT